HEKGGCKYSPPLQGGMAAIAPLVNNLTSKHWNFADTAAGALQSIGRPAVPAVREPCAGVDSHGTSVRTPQGESPTLIFLITARVARSTTDTSLDPPLAV